MDELIIKTQRRPLAEHLVAAIRERWGITATITPQPGFYEYAVVVESTTIDFVIWQAVNIWAAGYVQAATELAGA